MNDNFERDLKQLKDFESEITKTLNERKNLNKKDEITIKIEQKLYKDLERFKKDIEVSLKAYTEKYKTAGNQIEANNRINRLNEIDKSYKVLRKTYDELINNKYKYVSTGLIQLS